MKKIAVAMSGGVDSSVSAALLKEKGHEITGVFIVIRIPQLPCTVEKDRQDALRACAALQIPFIEYDASEIYKKEVLTPFLDSYRKGETPNPDIWCNTAVKFGVVFNALRKKGYNTIATGHYAQKKEKDATYRLFSAIDTEKDQTYFLYQLSQETLNKTVFPVGGMKKEQVRAYAKQKKLPAAEKKDSTGLCFLGDISLKDLLKEEIGIKKGDVVVSGEGKKIGTHDGFWFYTLGQRHGFTITETAGTPYKVVGKEGKKNLLLVAPCNEKHKEGGKSFTLKDVVLRYSEENEKVLARYRHRGEICEVNIQKITGNKAKVQFKEPKLIAKGQSIVIYTKQGECKGGGVVCESNEVV